MKINFTIDDEYVLIAAKKLGYQPELQAQTGQIVANPQSSEDYIEAYLESMLTSIVEQAVLEEEANTYISLRREEFKLASKDKIKAKKVRVDKIV